MTVSYYIVDAFTQRPFAGNPAGVVIVQHDQLADLDDERMREMAMEINQSETAFARKLTPGSNEYSIRYFTPDGSEVALCGHATLATAHILFNTLTHVSCITFHAKGGTLICRRCNDGRISMMFPSDVTTEVSVKDDGVAQAVIARGFEGLRREDIVYVGRGRYDYIIAVETQGIVEELVPNSSVLGMLSRDHDIRGFIVTAPAQHDDAHFVSRFFGPGVGIPEDPVTGSAHCTLGPYWATVTGTQALVGTQICPKRGGTVHVDTSHEGNVVEISGHAVLVSKATFVNN